MSGCLDKHTHTHETCGYSWGVLTKTLKRVSFSPWDHFSHLRPLFHRQSLEVDFGFSRTNQEACGRARKEAKILKTALIGQALTLG